MMLLSLITNTLHFFGDVLESFKYLHQLFARDNQEGTLYLSYGCTVTLVSLIFIILLVRVRKDVRVAEVRTFHIKIERDVQGFSIACLI